MATIQAIAEMQQPLFDAIERLESKMDARFDKVDDKFDRVDSRVKRLELMAAGSLIPLIFISYRLLSSIPG